MRRRFVLLLAFLLLAGTHCSSSSDDGGQTGADTGVQDDTAGPGDDTAGGCKSDDDCADTFDDLAPCEAGLCRRGECVKGAATNYSACDDGDPCTEASFCVEGACEGGLATVCDDGDPCTRDACDSDGAGCTNTALDGIPCDDGDPCTRNDRCVTGVCGGTLRDECACESDADCVAQEDGDLCNGTLRCVDGGCRVDEATVIHCDTTGDSPCAPTVCEPATGMCGPGAAPDGTPCEDGNFCTQGDICSEGLCASGEYRCEPCEENEECAPHDDANVCNGTLHCFDGECRTNKASVVTCDASDEACVAKVCRPEDGECVNVDRADGTTCDDGDLCTLPDRCAAGACEGTARDCDDGDRCTTDACDATDGCTHTQIPGCGCESDADCDDGDPCTADSCDDAGICQHEVDEDCRCAEDSECDDGNPCTTDSCDPELSACQHEARPDGDVCGDPIDVCHGDSVCATGECGAGTPVVCDDGVGCTADTCDPGAGGCVHTPTDTCPCTVDGDCDDGNACTIDSCDSGTMNCAFLPADAGTACDDGNVCTEGDTCNAQGGCVPGAARDCGDGNACTQDLCDPEAGCSNPPATDGTLCDDGDPCTAPDVCAGGVCQAGDDVCLPETDCRNGVDDDDDGATDCDDGDCAEAASCNPETACNGAGTVDFACCRDTVDNDLDEVRDCADDDCAAAPNCNPEADCSDGEDDDFDGDVDCADSDCAADPYCLPEGDCRDGVDNDMHGDTDCDDPDCVADPYCLPELDCENGVDDDLHGDTDCDDPDCERDLACVDVCASTRPIACNTTESGDNTGVVSLVDVWGCVDWAEPGGEQVFAFTPDQDIDDVFIQLAESGSDHDLIVLGAGCDPRECIATGTGDVTIDVLAGQTYYIVVDGYEIAPEGAFDLTVTCDIAPDVETVCDDGVDEDEDGATDCDDLDCVEAEPCQGPACEAVADIVCEDSISGTTVGGAMRIDSLACAGVDERGPEVAYRFVAPATEEVRFVLTPEDGADLDLYILEEECEIEACVDWGITTEGEDLTLQAEAGHTYYILVDGPVGLGASFQLDVACGCANDAWEPNDSPVGAPLLMPGTYDDLALCTGDGDFFTVELCDGAVLTVTADYDLAEGNVDLMLLNPSYLQVASDSESDLQASITYEAPFAGNYILGVELNPDDGIREGNRYDLTVNVDETACGAGPGLCDLPTPIGCGMTFSASTTGVDDRVNIYGCTGFDQSGGEMVYAFTAPRDITGARFHLAADLAQHDVLVLPDGCEPLDCLAFGDSEALFDAVAGDTYYLVVDGRSGSAGDFTISLDCPAEPEDCTNGSDDDGDLLTDCDDPDCVAHPSCEQTCTAGWTFSCGDSDSWTTAGAPNAIDTYSCVPGITFDGGEFVYDITPDEDTFVTVTMEPTGGTDLDLLVLSGDCASGSCVASSLGDVGATEQLVFAATAGTTYYVVIDSGAASEGAFEISLQCGDAPSLCDGATPIVCGQQIGGDNTGLPSTVDDYGCGFYTEAGGEVVYEFVASETLTGVRAELVLDSADHDVNVLGADCDPATCIEQADNEATFDVVAGETYYVVVDGYQGNGEGTFTLQLHCPGATEICDNGLDDDDDGDTDCDDSECTADAACTVDCAPYAVECGLVDTFTTAGAGSAINSYTCGAADARGPDYQYEITLLERRTVTATLTPDPAGAALDLYVLEAACDGDACIAHSASPDPDGGVETVEFTAEAGVTYYVVVDGAQGPGSDYTLELDCAAWVDPLCRAPLPIACGDLLAGDNTGLENRATDWGCSTWSEPGGEIVYAFTPVQDVVGVTFALDSETADHDLYRLDAACDPSACLDSGDNDLTFDAAAGETYLLVVDGYEGDAEGSFSVSLTCPPPQASETDCANGLDEDADGLPDCQDTDCQSDPACAGTCAAPAAIECDVTVLGDTQQGLSEHNNYFCASPYGDDQTGPEAVYVFTPAADVQAQISLLDADGWDGEIMVMMDGCDANSCAAYYGGSGLFSFQTGHTYYIVVDGYMGAAGTFGLSFECQ